MINNKFLSITKVPGSFRDPSGFIFIKNRELYRQVNLEYKENYDHFIRSGLYEKLTSSGLIITHVEANFTEGRFKGFYKILKPKLVKFISYPYEWSFSQLKDAALTTLQIQKYALDFGMSLKDSSAYNIQFVDGKPVLIDTLSFEKYKEGKPWVAYKQFCQHFLAPLALMCHRDIRLNQLLRIYLDGIPLDLAASLLPFRCRLNIGLLLHLYFHSSAQKYYIVDHGENKWLKRKFSLHSFYELITNLQNTIKGLQWVLKGPGWGNYYDDPMNPEYIEHKKELVARYIEIAKPSFIWDLGSNTGVFSRLASDRGIPTISFDNDPTCVEKNYLETKNKREINILPLLLDLNNPSPPIGWENREQMSLLQRGPAELVIALALVHHLAISNNLPLDKIADFFQKVCKSLIIEYIPKKDPNVLKLLQLREDIFNSYTQHNFEKVFDQYFNKIAVSPIKGTGRILYLFKRK